MQNIVIKFTPLFKLSKRVKISHLKIFFFASIYFSPICKMHAQTTYTSPSLQLDENYIFTQVYQKPIANPATQITYNSDVIENVVYYDGLGRPEQEVNIKASPNQKDIVTLVNSYCNDSHYKDSVNANVLITKEILSLENKGILKSNIFSFYDDSGKIVIAWKAKEKYRSIKIYYKRKKFNIVKKQKLSKSDKENIETIISNPNALLKLSNLSCDERVHSFSKVYVKLNNYSNSYFTHCKQDEELKALTSLYFSLRN